MHQRNYFAVEAGDVGLQGLGLGAGHVGPEPAQEDHARPFAGGLVISDVAALRGGEEGCHAGKIAIVRGFRQGVRNGRAKNRAWLDLGGARGHQAPRHNPQPGVS